MEVVKPRVRKVNRAGFEPVVCVTGSEVLPLTQVDEHRCSLQFAASIIPRPNYPCQAPILERPLPNWSVQLDAERSFMHRDCSLYFS